MLHNIFWRGVFGVKMNNWIIGFFLMVQWIARCYNKTKYVIYVSLMFIGTRLHTFLC